MTTEEDLEGDICVLLCSGRVKCFPPPPATESVEGKGERRGGPRSVGREEKGRGRQESRVEEKEGRGKGGKERRGEAGGEEEIGRRGKGRGEEITFSFLWLCQLSSPNDLM